MKFLGLVYVGVFYSLLFLPVRDKSTEFFLSSQDNF